MFFFARRFVFIYTNICLACFHFVKIHIWCTFDFLSSPYSVSFLFRGVQWRNYLSASAMNSKQNGKKEENLASQQSPNLNMNGTFLCPWIETLWKNCLVFCLTSVALLPFLFSLFFFPFWNYIRLECLQWIKWINWLRRECWNNNNQMSMSHRVHELQLTLYVDMN